ncbi:hypothetical protein [Amycolatopsis sp. cmx-4-68]|uniref:hypothetical protein n=1 Tax=Amycolatopsis sp. cmx-4-68 TaxID=2790938 RepID=UPI003979010A
MKRDRELLAGLSRVNAEIGNATIRLLTLQVNDAEYAAELRQLGRDLVRIGVVLAARAGELDGLLLDPAELLPGPSDQPGEPS